MLAAIADSVVVQIESGTGFCAETGLEPDTVLPCLTDI